MKLVKTNNDWAELQSNGKAGDFAKMLRVAEMMQTEAQGDLVIIEAEEDYGYITMSAVWNNYQAAEFKDLYQIAKARA